MPSTATLINIWLVLAGIGGYQLFLQLHSRGRAFYHEGFLKTLQNLTGIPALGSLALFLLDPDSLSFVFLQMPHHLAVAATLAGLTLFNIAAFIVVWAHVTLGKFWSGDLETHPEHRVIDTGPYALVRHPLYSSYLLLTLGFFLATADWFVSILMFVYFATVAARAEREEDMLAERLGSDYLAYCEKTPRFLPRILDR